MTGRALIFLCDIVGYSKLPDEAQSKAVQNLWDIAMRDPFTVDLRSTHAHGASNPVLRMSGTGDGFYLVLWNYQDHHTREMYEFARRLIDRVRQQGRDLKVALHEDPASTWKTRRGRSALDGGGKLDWEEISGSGLNYCQRIIGYPAAGQVVFTEDFLSKWPLTQERRMPREMHPPYEDVPIRINVKHNVPMRIRFDSKEASVLVQKIALVGAAITQEMRQIMDQLHKEFSKYSPEQLNARLSVFTPTYVNVNESYLDCTALRVAYRPSVKIGRTQTFYSIIQGHETGLGICYAQKSPMHVMGLPTYDAEPNKYCSAIKRAWKVEPSEVRSWSRKARAFLSIPIGLAELEADPIGVLCIDLDCPLKHYKGGEVEKICAIIAGRVQTKLVYLLELRSRS